ncbi:CynX/NimT family MFS transporter [Paenibacillus paeoniae]|uniref:MFS transporter n=1 Tax=Paenibacillus paeoniae TaxID=2292705 RepID=A0A371PN65_9BACL|nr:MFS transporter [Paenibacillus paeoniae]REK77650.1 MFS transporter [Paenibacillus paeoniae]
MKKLFLLLAIFIAALNLRPIISSVAPLLGTMQSTLGMNALTASLLTTLPVLCMGLFAPAATMLRDRWGLERTIFIALALITGATVMRGVISSVGILVITAVIGGIGISLAGPLLSGFIKKYFPTKPGIVSVYSVSLTVGASAAAACSIPIYNRYDQSISIALAVWAILGVLALLVWFPFLGRKDQASSMVRSRLPLRNKRAILLTLFFGLMASMFYSLTAWISPIAQSLGYSKASSAMLLTVFTIIQIPVSMTLPSLVSKYGKRGFFLVICSIFELIGIIMLMLHMPMLPAVIFLGIGAGGLFPLALMLPIVETSTPQEAGAWSAMSQCGGYLIGAMGPLIVGGLYDYRGNFTLAFAAMFVVILVMIVVQLLLSKSSGSVGLREGHR